MGKAYCMWFDKFLKDVAEHEMEQCQEHEQDCDRCGNLTFREEKENEDRPD